MSAILSEPAMEESHAILRDTVRRFAETEVILRAAAIDREDSFPHDLYRRMAELGLIGLNIEERYGGSGAGEVNTAIVLEELGRISCLVANACLLPKLQAELICRRGDETQIQRFVPSIVAGSIICLIAVTEPGAGSDVASITTTAQLNSEHWVLNGTKHLLEAQRS